MSLRMKELDAISSLEQFGMGIVPILHDIDFETFVRHAPLSSRNLAVSSNMPLAELAHALQRRAARDWGHTPDYRQGEYDSEINFPLERLAVSVRATESLLFRSSWEICRATIDLSRDRTWMGSDDKDLAEIGFQMLFPLVYFCQKERSLQRSRSEYADQDRTILDLLTLCFDAYVDSERFAAWFTGLEYAPRVSWWRRLREEYPGKYLLQGLDRVELRRVVDFLERRFGRDIISLHSDGFSQIFQECFRKSGDGYKDIGLLFNPIFRFKPADRPVFMRITWTCYALFNTILYIKDHDKTDHFTVEERTREFLVKFQRATDSWPDPRDREVCNNGSLDDLCRYLTSQLPQIYRAL